MSPQLLLEVIRDFSLNILSGGNVERLNDEYSGLISVKRAFEVFPELLKLRIRQEILLPGAIEKCSRFFSQSVD